MSAIISPCGKYRYRLDRDVQPEGLVFAYFGVNPSTADAVVDDPTVKKWLGFTQRKGGRKFIVGNVFAYRSTDVKQLRVTGDDLFGPDWGLHMSAIIQEADVLVPCWGALAKMPAFMRDTPGMLLQHLRASGKPVMSFGLNNDGTPKHPQMLAYATPLEVWQ